MPVHNRIADLIVKGAIALVTAAVFIGAYLQFQVSFWLALIAAGSVYVALLMLHALMRRSERVDTLASEVSRLEVELARLKGGDAQTPPPVRNSAPRGAAPARAPAKAPPPLPGARPAPKTAAPQPPAHSTPPVPPGRQPPRVPQRLQPATHAPPVAPASSRQELAAHAPWPGAAAQEPMHDYWSFRPADEASFGQAQKPRSTAPSPKEGEADLEAVQGMIKRLADELDLGNAPRGREPSPETVTRVSVDALQAAAETMRAAAAKASVPAARPAAAQPPAAPPRTPSAPAAPTPPPIAPQHSRLSAIAAAIAAGRMDVLLEPVVGLADQQLHHYALSIRPRDEMGAVLPLAAHDPELSGTGLFPMIDGARCRQAVRLCRTFAETGQRHCVFTAASAESLLAERFIRELSEAYRARQALAEKLVLTFTQADIRAFRGAEWSALTDLRDQGFRFGLESVTDVDYEFTALRAAGFAFARLDAAMLLAGLPGPGGVMPAANVCRHLAELGLAVVVIGVDDEATRATVIECGVPLAQGRLFGPPLPVAGEAVAGPGNAAA